MTLIQKIPPTMRFMKMNANCRIFVFSDTLKKVSGCIADIIYHFGYLFCISTILDLNWLPILELRDYSLFKTIFKALYPDNWSSYLNLEVVKPIRHLRSSVAPRLYVPLVQGTFQHSAAITFNELPANRRNCKDFKEYCRLCKAFLKVRALSPP